MKFIFEMELGVDDLTVGMVRDALEYDDNWPKDDRSTVLNVVDVNGRIVGKWEIAEPAPVREPNNPVLTQYQIVTSSTAVCIGCDEVIYSDRAEYAGEDQPYCPTCAKERGM